MKKLMDWKKMDGGMECKLDELCRNKTYGLIKKKLMAWGLWTNNTQNSWMKEMDGM